MDVGDNEKLDSEKRNEDSVSYHTPRFRGAEFVNSSMGVVSDGKGDLLNSMADSYGTTVWDNPSVNQIGLAGGWQEQNSVAKNGFLLPTVSGTIPHLSHLPADSAFIERAARFSYFNSGNIVDLMNTFPMNQPVSPYHQLTSMPCGPIETNPPSTSKDDRRRSPPEKNARRGSETKQSDSDEAESVGGRGEEETSLMDTSTEPSLPKGYGPKKRRRAGQDTELEQSQQLSGEDANGNSKNSSPVKISGKNAKSSSQADPSKEEYIHIRARRGQATNSHSLAERIRREKISERMKFLQDLVPGCSKVTGKAVMLDEIINYVQSLQRQVEFLSMKLATVDPRVDFNIDSLLAKEQLFPTLAGVSSSMGFSPDVQMAYPPIHPSHPIGIHPPVIGNTSDALRNLNPQLTGINEATQQMPNVWDYELQNVVQMGFDPNAPIDNQETNNSSLPRMKVEP